MNISVIIPAYNSAQWLSDAVESVLSQSRPAHEILVVDDGSTDETKELCQKWVSRVRYVWRENGGVAAAKNTGTRATSGDWLLFLEADDKLLPHALESLAERAAAGRERVVYGYVLLRGFRPTETRLHGLPWAVGPIPTATKTSFWWTVITSPGAALIARSLDEGVGHFDERFRMVDDCEYWLRCGMLTEFAHCDTVVLDKRWTANSLGSDQAGSIWYRLQLQLEFLRWARRRGMDTGFLAVSPRELVDHALKRVLATQAWGVLRPILRVADRLGVKSRLYFRGKAIAGLRSLSGSLSAAPAFCDPFEAVPFEDPFRHQTAR